MQTLLPLAEDVGRLLKERGEKIVVAESAAGGLINAALLAIPGASAWCLGGAVLYTRESQRALNGIQADALKGMTPSTEAYALFTARTMRERLGAHWCLSETGTAGPTGSRYGFAPGHACFAVAGPIERTHTIETGSSDRLANMVAFAQAGLIFFRTTLQP